MAAQLGIVGFFDILGYQNYLENNEASGAVGEAVDRVLQILNDMPKQAQKRVKDIFPNDSFSNQVVAKTDSLVFSDAILLTLAYDVNQDDATKKYHWLLFLLQTAILTRQMFDFGLPLRGAVTFGSFIVQKGCFAGRPILEAYRMTTQIDAAAVVLTKTGEDEMTQTLMSIDAKLSPYSHGLLADYLMPMKGSDPHRLHVVNFTTLSGHDPSSLVGDERKLVYESFSRHRKDIPPAVYGKLTNTEVLLRFLKSVTDRLVPSNKP